MPADGGYILLVAAVYTQIDDLRSFTISVNNVTAVLTQDSIILLLTNWVKTRRIENGNIR